MCFYHCIIISVMIIVTTIEIIIIVKVKPFFTTIIILHCFRSIYSVFKVDNQELEGGATLKICDLGVSLMNWDGLS